MLKRSHKITSALVALLCTTGTLGAFSACANAPATGAPSVTTSTRLELPTDETLPTACTGAQNLGYIATVLDSQTQYHVYTYTETNAAIAMQITKGYKDFKDGVMMSTDITYSSMVKTGTQALFIDGEAYMRNSAPPTADTDHLTAEWSTEQPIYYNHQDYLTAYGLFGTELSQYIINDETIADFSVVTDNGDGTYTQSFTFDAPSAAYYSQYGMKKRGGLFGFPEFISLEMSFTFDASWKILTYDIYEVAMVNKGVTVKSITDSHVEYFYDEQDFDEQHFAYYENFFKDYVGKCSSSKGDDEELVLDATTLLSSGFAKVLEGGQQFEINLILDEKELVGYVFLSLELEDVLNSIDVKLSLGPTVNEQYFYFEYANGEGNAYYRDEIALYLNISTLKESINQFSEWLDALVSGENPQPDETEPEVPEIAPDTPQVPSEPQNPEIPSEPQNPEVPKDENGGETPDGDLNGDGEQEGDKNAQDGVVVASEESDPLADLLNSFVIEKTKHGANLTLQTGDLLGTGIGADVKMYFGVKGQRVSLYGLSLDSLSYRTDGIKFKAGIKATGAPVISHDKTQTQANLTDYVTDVHKLLSSNLVKVGVKLDGASPEVKIPALKGVYLDGGVYADAKGLNVGADLHVSYTKDGNKISATISAVYDYERNSNTYGQIYISLIEFNGVKTSLNLYCDITEVVDGITNLLHLAGIYEEQPQPEQEKDDNAQTEIEVAKLINGIITFDYSAVLGDFYVGKDALRLAVDVDGVMAQLGVDAGVSFGTASLTFNPYGDDVSASLALSLSGLGLSIDLSGDDETFTIPERENYFNLIKVVELATNGYEQIDNIAKAQDVYFEIDAILTVDGLSVGAVGCGEVVWVDGLKSVALSLEFHLIDGNSMTERDVTEFRFLYDETLFESDDAFVQMAINDLGFEIYKSDIKYVEDKFAQISSALSPLFAQEEKNDVEKAIEITQNQTQVKSTTLESVLEDENTAIIFDWLFKTLSSSGWVSTLANDVGVQIDGTNFAFSLLSSWAIDVAIGVDGGLSLEYNVAEKGTPVTQAQILARVGEGTLKGELLDEFDQVVLDENGTETSKYNFYSTAQCEQAFTRLVYNYLFAFIEEVDVTGVLGDNTYNVHFAIDGNNCNIPELKDVTVRADLYFTNVTQSGKKVSKIKEIDLDVQAPGAIVKINVVYQSNCFYLKLPQIQNIILSDFKVMSTTDTLFDTVEGLVGIITDTNLLSMFGGVSLAQAEQEISTFNIDETMLVGLVAKIVTFDFNAVLSCNRVDGVAVAELDLDAFASQLDFVPEYALGKVAMTINQTTHEISTDGVVDGKTWISLRSTLAERRDYSYINPDEYVNAGFLPVLIQDAKNFATDDDGNVYNTFSFSGTIKAKLVSMVDLTIDITTLTLGIDQESGLYISLLGNVSPAKVLGIEIVGGGLIGFTYANGYITIARNVATNVEYRVMTIEYFIDNLFTASDVSPLKWLLDVSDFGWDTIIANAVKGSVDLNSGLSTPEQIYLYNNQALDSDTEILVSDYIKGITVNVNGTDITTYGSQANRDLVCEKLGVSSNYYGMNLDAETITEGVLTQIYAAIMRDDQTGINGVKVKGAIASYVDFNINLDKYAEGATVPYISGSGDNLYRALSSGDIMREISRQKVKEGHVYYVYDVVTGKYVQYDQTVHGEDATLYYACMDGVFTLNGSTFNKANIYVDGTQYYTFYVSPNFYKEIEDKFVVARDAITYRTNVTTSSGEIYDEVFGEYNSADDSVDISKKLYSLKLTVYDVGGKTREMIVKAGSTIYLYDNAFPVFDGNGNRIAYVDENGNLIGKSMVLTEDSVIYAQAFAPSTVTIYNNGQYFATIKSFIGDEMPVEVAGYTMISDTLYIDGETPVTAGTRVQDSAVALYGEFVQTEVTINSVVYTFDFNTKSYYVSATVSGIHKYADESSVLTLESTIGAYKVTAIGERGLACSSPDATKSIKNIIVPASITKIGKQAFADNVGIKKVIFLADSVYFDGKENDKNLPFAGCSSEPNGKKTNVAVYYNAITTNGDDWGWFNNVSLHNYHIGDDHWLYGESGGARYGAGTWSYVRTENNSTTSLEKANDYVADVSENGLILGTYDCASAQNTLLSNINAYTSAQFGYINGHTVSVNSAKDAFGYTVITIAITDQTPWYEITVVSNAGDVKVDGAYLQEYNGKTYAKGEITLTAIARKGYEFDSWGDGTVKDNPATFTVNGVSTYTANYVSTLVPVTVYSAVDFVYDGQTYTDDVVQLSVAKEDGTLYALTPTANGYSFAGWAKMDGENLTFTELNAEGVDYYAIWAKTSAGEVVESTTGTLPTCNSTTFYGWYADGAFTTQTDKISVQNTVLYARQQYSFNFSITGGVKATTLGKTRTDFFITENGEAKNQTNVESYSSGNFTVLEGDVMTVVNLDGNSYEWQITCGDFNAIVRVDYMKRKSIITSTWTKDSGYTITPNITSKTVSGNLSLTFSH